MTTAIAPALDAAQIQHFIEHGWLLASDLIPREVALAADAHTWTLLGFDPADPATWVEPQVKEYMPLSDAYAACYTTPLLAAAAQLLPDPLACPLARAPDYAFVIRILPEPGPWRSGHNLHIDSTGAYSTAYMQAWRLSAMVYLHDVAPQAGRTVVWDASHTRIMAHVRSDPTRHKWLKEVDLSRLDLGEPLEVAGKAGDVLFFDPLLAHAKPMNVGGRPRFAMNIKWPG
ncbi:MAG TPA: phytanoyl-CoA dioxygenase family protein [Planctomycetota bacterium]|nr:phytanoyl-CoA dioxygenase family protein [Planctomycetota bacterium]